MKKGQIMLVTALTLGLTSVTIGVTNNYHVAEAAVINNSQQTLHFTKQQKHAINQAFLQWAVNELL